MAWLGEGTQTIREAAQGDGVDADIEVKWPPGFLERISGQSQGNQSNRRQKAGDPRLAQTV